MVEELMQETKHISSQEVLVSDGVSLKFERELDSVVVKLIDHIALTETLLCTYRDGIWNIKTTVGDHHYKMSLFWNYVKAHPKRTNKIIKTLLNTKSISMELEWDQFKRKVRIQSHKIDKAFKNLN